MLYGLLTTTSVSFTPAKDIPDLSGKVIFITGGNVGLGKESALQLSHHNPSHIYLSCRSAEKATAAISSIQAIVPNARITFLQCDLASLSSVQAAAREFVNKESRLDILMLNAGIMAVPQAVTEEGYEVQFGTNHVGHALLTKLLLPTLLKTAALPQSDVRVISLSSIGHTAASGIAFSGLKIPSGGLATNLTRYGQSKLANILFVRELHKRFGEKGITAVAVHPGVVKTELYRTMYTGVMSVGNLSKMFYTSVPDGTKGQLWAATAKRGNGATEVKGGAYYTPVGVPEQCSGVAKNLELATKLWEWTEKEIEGYNI